MKEVGTLVHRKPVMDLSLALEVEMKDIIEAFDSRMIFSKNT